MNSWSSVTSVNFGKIREEGQSAGNFMAEDGQSDKGSSETIREAIKIYNTFKWWFIGFAEGDGSFILNKDGYLELKITQSSVDAQIFFFIKKNLGFGSVSVQDKNNKTHHYRVRDKNNILKLIQIFNCNILTKYKINQFKVWVNGFNNKYNMNIQLLDCNHKVKLDNAWLSGFTDAEGCFSSSILTSKQGKTTVTVRYFISQKDDIEFSKEVATLLYGYIVHIKSEW